MYDHCPHCGQYQELLPVEEITVADGYSLEVIVVSLCLRCEKLFKRTVLEVNVESGGM